MTSDRVVDFRSRTVLRLLLIVLAVALSLEIVWIAREVVAWIVIAVFLALALDPLVGWIERRVPGQAELRDRDHVRPRPDRVVGVGATFIPKLIDEVNGLPRPSLGTSTT